MKTTSIKTLRIDERELVNQFFESTHIIGLISDLPDYQLCWHLNRELDMDFRVNDELEIQWQTSHRRIYYFTVFEYVDMRSSNVHYLYNNHKQGIVLLPEIKHINYIWLIKGPYFTANECNEWLQLLHRLPYIRMAIKFLPEDLKNRQNLIL
ncbi:MAG: IPExxxVDY family protein [Thermoflavifilum sp.]|nr:IPExxxVDY family protein [Thermoflavifilum sp.]